MRGPQDRLAFLRGTNAELVRVALTDALPTTGGSFRPPSGSQASCPTWGDEGETLGFIVTAADGSSSAYVWTSQGAAPTPPSPPKLVSNTARRVYAVMHR